MADFGLEGMKAEPQPPSSIDMSTVVSNDRLGTQLLTLIDTNVCANLTEQNEQHVGKVQHPKQRGGKNGGEKAVQKNAKSEGISKAVMKRAANISNEAGWQRYCR